MIITSTPLVFYDALGNTSSSSYSTLTSSPASIRHRSESSDALAYAPDAKRRRSALNPLLPSSLSSPTPVQQWRQASDMILPPTVLMCDVNDLDSLPASTLQSSGTSPIYPTHASAFTGLPTPESGDESSYPSVVGSSGALRSALKPNISLTAKALALKASNNGTRAFREPLPETSLRDCGARAPRSVSPDAPGVVCEASRKDQFVAGLVGACVIAIESIWGRQTSADDAEGSAIDGSVLPLRLFVREVLRRSRTSCSTLQVALYYLHKGRREIRDAVARADQGLGMFKFDNSKTSEIDAYPSPPHSPIDGQSDDLVDQDQVSKRPNAILCGRRMFLASLIVASKFLQDRNYSNRAWAKISGLPVTEINENERIFLALMNFQLHLRAEDFQKWTERLASLASQGAALESISSMSEVQPARMGLSRHASEYPAAAPLQGLRPSIVGPRVPLGGLLGRSRSQPIVSYDEPSLRSSHATLAVPTTILQKRNTLLRQTATPVDTPIVFAMESPAPTDLSSASSSEVSPPRELRTRHVLPLPATTRKSVHDVPPSFAHPREACMPTMGRVDMFSWDPTAVQAH